jgi:Tfp pilus assembly protein PilF
MTRQTIRGLLTGVFALLVMAWTAPAFAQTGALRGKVVDETGKPVDQAEVIFDFVGDIQRQLKTVTDKNGEWIRVGIPIGGGTYTITAKKGNLSGSIDKISVQIGQTTKVRDIIIVAPGSKSTGKPASMSSEDAKKAAETDKLLDATNAAIEAGNYDDAIEKLKNLIERLATERKDMCPACHAKLGDVYLAKTPKDDKAAEAAYLKAIEIDPSKPGPYNALAAMYNEQRKFEEATKMSAKATELMGASGSTDPSAVYNQGVILWNQSKIAEAKAQWTKAIELDPKMADAHYWLGMANVNQNNVADAKKNFTTYLELAPKGQYADTAKAILASIK